VQLVHVEATALIICSIAHAVVVTGEMAPLAVLEAGVVMAVQEAAEAALSYEETLLHSDSKLNSQLQGVRKVSAAKEGKAVTVVQAVLEAAALSTVDLER